MSELAQAIAAVERELDALEVEELAWRETAVRLTAEVERLDAEAAERRERQLGMLKDNVRGQ